MRDIHIAVHNIIRKYKNTLALNDILAALQYELSAHIARESDKGNIEEIMSRIVIGQIEAAAETTASDAAFRYIATKGSIDHIVDYMNKIKVIFELTFWSQLQVRLRKIETGRNSYIDAQVDRLMSAVKQIQEKLNAKT